MRFSAIGDCVMAAHAATSVRKAYPDAFLVWAIEKRCAAVADTSTLLSMRYEFNREEWRTTRWSPRTWWASLSTYGKLRKCQFDLGLDLQGHSKTALCLYLAKPKRRLAAQATDIFARSLNPRAHGDPSSMHVVEWNYHVLRQLLDAPQVLRPFMPNLDPKNVSNLVTISTGAGAKDKEWPVESWQKVGESLREQGFHVVFLGGPGDPVPHWPDDQVWVGKLALTETMSWIASSRLHLAADTGSGHIAAAYDVPVVSVFGPTDPNRYRPYTKGGTVLRAGPSTADVKPADVVQAALDLLDCEAK